MRRKAGDGISARVRRVRDQIALWRRTRRTRSAMPVQLWAEAVSLARTEGSYRVARALRVDYGSLARRVAEAQAGSAEGAASAPAFVELRGAPLLGVSPSAVVELLTADGARLVIQLGPSSSLDVAELVQRFRERRA